MKYFTNINTIEELKKEYRRLIKTNHPDNGGDTWVMAEINNEYEPLFNRLKAGYNAKAAADATGKTKEMQETPEMFREILEKIINLDGITIELCGSWIWVSGETKQYKDILKACDFRWASKKCMWYWRCEADAVHGKGKSRTMEQIRNKYGSDVISSKEAKKLTA